LADASGRVKSFGAAFGAVLTVVQAAAEPAASAPDEVTASLELVSTPGCGSEPELAAAIASRSERIRIVAREAATRALRIELKEVGGGLVATLSLTQPSGRRSQRTLKAANCAEALDAAALVAAVSLDPTASSAPAESVSAVPPAVTPAPAERSCPPCAEPAPPREPAPADGLVVSVALWFEALSGPAPAVMPGVAAGVMLGYERDSVLSPAVRVSYAHFARGDFATSAGTADFTLDALTVELCPLRAKAGPLVIYPCVLRVTGGELLAEGSNTLEPRSRGRPWWVVGSSLVGLVRPSSTLELTFTLGAGRPLIRDRFQFEPLEFHRVSGVAFGAGAGAGVTFP
jgi:hypothetical protein